MSDYRFSPASGSGGAVSAPAPALHITPLQRSMVSASLSAPRDGIYLIQDVCELPGPIDVGLLRRAWRAVVARCPALRCAIHFEHNRPVGFRFDNAAAERWYEKNFTDLTGEPYESRLANFLRADREHGFHFENGGPVRLTVVRNPGSGVTLVWTVHHALLDGRSLTLAWQLLLEYYDALVESRDLPPLEAPQAAPLFGPADPDSQARSEDFWRDYFRGVSHTTGFIVDRVSPPPEHSGDPIGRERLVLSVDSTRLLQNFAGLQQVALNTLVQGAWALLLSRYSGRRDVVFGVARSRPTGSPQDARNLGFHLDTVPLRLDVDPQARSASWLKGIRARWLALRQVEATTARKIAESSGLPPGAPPFDSVLNYDHEPPGETLSKLGGRWSAVRFRRLQRTDSPLTLVAYGSPTLTLEVVYDAVRFSHRTMAAALAHLSELLESFVTWPDARLRDLNMLTARERQLPLRGPEPMPVPDVGVHRIFERQAEQTPSLTAIDAGPGTLSYRQLNLRSNRLGWRLREDGVGPGDIVAVCMEASPESVIAILAVLKAGAAFLPIDPQLPAKRIEDIIADARPKLALHRDVEASVSSTLACPTLVVSAWNAGPWSAGGEDQCANLPDAATPVDLAYIIYTSGSSGRPKAVAMPHRALANHSLAAARAYGLSETDRRLQTASIGADVFVAEVFNYLCCGAALVFGWDRRSLSIRDFLRCLEDLRITVTGIPSAWWTEWVAAAERSMTPLPASLRAVIIGMEKADPAVFSKWKQLIGPAPRLFNAYGPAETSPTATVYEAGTSAFEANSYVPIGKPLANTAVYVLDEQGSPAPVGVAGELYIGGAGVAREYWNQPELTAERFVADPFGSASGRLYRTGDIVFFLPDGNLVFLGRADRQVKIRGFRVELDEIEAVLARHSEVKQCAIVTAGSGAKQSLGAFVVFRGGGVPVAELRHYLAGRLPEHMIPAAFVTLPALPQTPNGKTDRQALPLAQLARVAAGPEDQTHLSETGKRLAEVWREVLGVSAIHTTDNFFDLGADSLDAVRLATLVEAQFGIAMPGATLWQFPTLGGMAAALESRLFDLGYEEAAVVPLQPHGSRIPFFCFPGADDNPGTFLQVARNLGTDQPFFVVRDPRPIADREVYSVEQAAARFVDAIRRVRPSGPYILGGHCYGGLLAFEAARRLASLGVVVPRILMMEVPTPGYPRIVRNWKNYLKVAHSILRGRRRLTLRDAREHSRVLVKLARKRTQIWKRRSLRRVQAVPGVPPIGAATQTDGPPEHPNIRAGRNYLPLPLACDLVQIIAAGEHHETVILDDPRLGWRDLTQGTFSVADTPGPANAIFKPPYVRELASRLESLLAGVAGPLRHRE